MQTGRDSADLDVFKTLLKGLDKGIKWNVCLSSPKKSTKSTIEGHASSRVTTNVDLSMGLEDLRA